MMASMTTNDKKDNPIIVSKTLAHFDCDYDNFQDHSILNMHIDPQDQNVDKMVLHTDNNVSDQIVDHNYSAY